jgi:hypothetical protein
MLSDEKEGSAALGEPRQVLPSQRSNEMKKLTAVVILCAVAALGTLCVGYADAESQWIRLPPTDPAPETIINPAPKCECKYPSTGSYGVVRDGTCQVETCWIPIV